MELNPDIQTGRNVYADKDLYESDDTYKAKIDSYVNEGFRLVYGDPDDPSEGGGSGGGGLVANATDEGTTRTLDKTWKEIKDAIASGAPVYIKCPDVEGYSDNWYISVTGCIHSGSEYSVQHSDTNQPAYYANSENEYPSASFQ